MGVLIVAGCGADVLINICLTLLGCVHPHRTPSPIPTKTATANRNPHKQVHPRPHPRLLHPLRLLQPRRPADPRARPRYLLRPCTDGRPRLPGGRLRHHQQPAPAPGRLEGLGQHLLRLPAREDLPAAAGRRRPAPLGLAPRPAQPAAGGQRGYHDVRVRAAPGRCCRLVLPCLQEIAGRRGCGGWAERAGFMRGHGPGMLLTGVPSLCCVYEWMMNV